MWEVGIIVVVALIILGPRQMVEAARMAGKLYREIQKLTWDIREQVNLDSISSLPDTDHGAPATPTRKPDDDSITDQDLVPPPGERSGPDFYADLIEKAAGEDADKDTPEPRSEPLEETDENSGEEKKS
jgi:Sec-independent protein translocase protein TatA